MMNTPEYVCALYFDGQIPCFGGILALNGKTGNTLWIRWTAHAIFSVDCDLDLTNDKIKDCIICGRGGIVHAINGRNGAIIWKLPVRDLSVSEEWEFSDIYDAKFIADIDGDNVGDIIASHTIQSREIHSSEILIISGINGNIIRSSVLPNTEQLFLAPQKLVHPDGENIFVLVTNSQKQSGGLYVISQVNLMYGNLELRKLHHDAGKGTLLPPILVDITLDGIEDIVATMFNSTIIVYNGLTFEPIWNYTVPNSEVISIPIPGYYNDDNVPDFMVKHQIGLGFPTYYYTVATIIDGKTGKSLLEKPIEDSLSREISGLSVSVEGFGNDWFLHWSVDCLNYEGVKQKYQFLTNENLISESRADLCKLRFNSTLITNLYALSQHVGPPGVSLYFSENWKFLEYNNSMNSRIELHRNTPFMSEQSTKVYKHENKKDAFKKEREDSYETDEQYAEHKNFSPTSSQNDNFSDDYILENEIKRPKKNIQASKDYVVPNKNNKSNTQKTQLINYLQINEVQEQRHNINRKFTNEFNNKINYSKTNIFKNKINSTNVTNTFESLNNYFQETDAENNENDNEKTKILRKRTNLLQNNINKIKGTTDQTFTDTVNTYAHNIVSNKGKANIVGKIIKRKSLKTQSGKIIINTKSKSKLPNKFETELNLKKEKREIKTKNDHVHLIHGIQKQPPTGILLPSFKKSKGITSIDLVFSTFWLPSSEVPIILIQEDLDCIHWKKMLSQKNLQYKQNDDIIKECLSERGIKYEIHQETEKEHLKISFGQMTIYRMKLECMCPEDMLPNQSCKNISLQQSWSEYLGSHGNGYFKPFYRTNF